MDTRAMSKAKIEYSKLESSGSDQKNKYIVKSQTVGERASQHFGHSTLAIPLVRNFSLGVRTHTAWFALFSVQ